MKILKDRLEKEIDGLKVCSDNINKRYNRVHNYNPDITKLKLNQLHCRTRIILLVELIEDYKLEKVRNKLSKIVHIMDVCNFIMYENEIIKNRFDYTKEEAYNNLEFQIINLNEMNKLSFPEIASLKNKYMNTNIIIIDSFKDLIK